MKYRIAIIIAVLALSACKDKPEPVAEQQLPTFITDCKAQYKRNNNQVVDSPLMFQYCGCLSKTYDHDTNNGRTKQTQVAQNEMLARCREVTAVSSPKGN